MGITSDYTFPDRIPLCLSDIRNLQNLSFLSIYTLLDISLTEKKLLGLECRYLQNNPALPGFIICSGVEKDHIPDVFKWLKCFYRYFNATTDIRDFSCFLSFFGLPRGCIHDLGAF